MKLHRFAGGLTSQPFSKAILIWRGASKRLMKKLLYNQRIAPYVFVLPFVLSLAIFFVYPVFSTFIMSFQEVLPGQTHFIGLDNYRNLWDDSFYTALWNSSKYTFWTILVLIPLPLVLAVFLNSK